MKKGYISSHFTDGGTGITNISDPVRNPYRLKAYEAACERYVSQRGEFFIVSDRAMSDAFTGFCSLHRIGPRVDTRDFFTLAAKIEEELRPKPVEHRFAFVGAIGVPGFARAGSPPSSVRVIPSAVRLEADGTIVVTE